MHLPVGPSILHYLYTSTFIDLNASYTHRWSAEPLLVVENGDTTVEVTSNGLNLSYVQAWIILSADQVAIAVVNQDISHFPFKPRRIDHLVD